jgi:predicted nucleic acid-binding protein
VIVIDSSVWIDHLRRTNPELVQLIVDGIARQHPAVIGELALGSVPQRERFIKSLEQLPRIEVVTDSDLLDIVSRHGLHGTGIGYVDAHLIASILVTEGARLWTSDKRLAAQAERLGCAYNALR